MRTRLYKLLPPTLMKMQDSVITLKSHFWKHSILTMKKKPHTHKMVNTYRSLTFVQFFVVSPLCRRSIEILKVSRGWIGSTSKKMAALSNPCAQAFLCLWRHCVRGHARTQPLICVGCSVHYLHYWLFCATVRGVFSRLPFVVVVDTQLGNLR